MENTKTEFKYFTIAEWKKEEKYLREQHKSGWEFVSVNFLGLYHFKKCETLSVIATSAKPLLIWTGQKKRFSVTMLPGWI